MTGIAAMSAVIGETIDTAGEMAITEGTGHPSHPTTLVRREAAKLDS